MAMGSSQQTGLVWDTINEIYIRPDMTSRYRARWINPQIYTTNTWYIAIWYGIEWWTRVIWLTWKKFGHDIAGKRNKRRGKLESVVEYYIHTPQKIQDINRDVILIRDVIFFNKIGLYGSGSWGLRLLTQ